MAQARLDRTVAQQTIDAAIKYGGHTAAAQALGIPLTTFAHRVREAKKMGLTPSDGIEDPANPAHLRAKVKRLEAALVEAEKAALNHEAIRQTIIHLAEGVAKSPTPSWVIKQTKPDSAPGVPTLFLSDLHWGEVVQPSQINAVNRYNVEVAHQRMAALAERTVRLLSILDAGMSYPGIVIPLGGDMISGNIHDELTATNELNSMPAVLDLFGVLTGFIGGMADVFGKVFLPCVTGNHGRDTHKIWNKDRHHTSFDWLLYCFLAKHFEKDRRVTFLIPDGPDAFYRIFNHRYLLTHGDQFRGGDGMIGALGPIIRGDHKKRSRNAQIDMEYDTMLLGHWHQDIFLRRLVVNGSLKGYDEYAYNNNFGFEPPSQQLWITHPVYGPTFRAPVYVDRQRTAASTTWVSVPS